MAVLFWLPCFGFPFPAVLFWLSCSGCVALAVLFWLSCPGCPGCPVLTCKNIEARARKIKEREKMSAKIQGTREREYKTAKFKAQKKGRKRERVPPASAKTKKALLSCEFIQRLNWKGTG
jgi:hypothetical protein